MVSVYSVETEGRDQEGMGLVITGTLEKSWKMSVVRADLDLSVTNGKFAMVLIRLRLLE